MRRKVFDLTKNDLTKDTEGISMQDLITAYDKFLFGDQLHESLLSFRRE